MHRAWLIAIAGVITLMLVIYFVGNWMTARAYDSKANQTLTVEAHFLVSSPEHAKRVGLTDSYGTVKAVSVRGVDARLFDMRTAFGFLVLDCTRGTVVLRADLEGPVGDTRLTEITAAEVAPAHVPDGILSKQEKNHYEYDFAHREQSTKSEFVLQYGDQ
jgi:hypothetical protein